MSWREFALDIALERDLLLRALPLVPAATGSSRFTIDLAAGTGHIDICVVDVIGTTPADCIELLRLRPLLFGAAWKILDMLFEHALEEAGVFPKGRWTLNTKAKAIGEEIVRPSVLDREAWTALTRTYANTIELRNSLVHRRVYSSATDALVGRDGSGDPLRPLSAAEQEAFVASALRAAQIIEAKSADDRAAADLIRQLDRLAGVHGQQLPSVTLADALPEITVIVHRARLDAGGYVLDVPRLLSQQPFQQANHVDLIVRFADRPGLDLRARLEDVPKEIVTIDPDNPPPWLT